METSSPLEAEVGYFDFFDLFLLGLFYVLMCFIRLNDNGPHRAYRANGFASAAPHT